MKKKRILKSQRFLEALLVKDDNFYVGLLLDDVQKSANLLKYDVPTTFKNDLAFMPKPKGTSTRANKVGKFVRKYPEEKRTKTVFISYSNKWGHLIEYYRDFNVYVKELKHKYEIELSYVINKHGVKMLVSPLLAFEQTDDSNMKNTHIINLFLEIFGDFEIYTSELEPALAFTNKYDFEVLPKGRMDSSDIEYLAEGARHFIRKEEEVKAYQKRLQILNEYNPEIVGKGSLGFWGYIVFGFKMGGIVLLESMYNQNATYIFDINTFESMIAKNKQDVLSHRLAKSRFMHNKNWENKIRRFLSNLQRA